MEIKGENKEKVIIVKTVDDVVCNKCGNSILLDAGSNISQFYKGTRLVADFGWGSNKDGLYECFDICDQCYDEFIDSFKHKPTEL